MNRELAIAVAAIVTSGRRMLVVRKRGTQAFMQPGGKIEPGERPIEALRRELREEIGLEVGEGDFAFAGVFSEVAENEADTRVTAHAFIMRGEPDIRLGAEIVEAEWIDLGADQHVRLARLSRNHILRIARQGTGILEKTA